MPSTKRKNTKSAAPRAKRARAGSPIAAEPTAATQADLQEHDGEDEADADGEAEEERAEIDADAEGDGDENQDNDEDNDEPGPTPARGRGRGRPRKTRGSVAAVSASGPTRSSPRKPAGPLPPQQTGLQSPQEKAQRGRKPARSRGRPRGSGRGAAPARTSHDDDDGEGDAVPEQPQPQLQPQPQSQPQPLPEPEPLPQQPVQQPHAQQPPPPPPQGFGPHVYPPYPAYPSHAPPYPYAYPDGRTYLPLRPDNAPPPQPMFTAPTPQTSFGGLSYDGAPQGNPFPPFGAVYGVPRDEEEEDDDDDDDLGVQPAVQAQAQARKRPTQTAKAGGRAGRGDHVACHFCRGRKLKCDGRRPTCGHCALRSLACAYDEAVRRRGPGKKEKNARRPRPGSSAPPAPPPQAHDVVVPDLGGPVRAEDAAPRPTKRRRRPTPAAAAAVLRFDNDEGAVVPGGAKPASAAYGVETNERLGYYYAPPGYALPPGPAGPAYWDGEDGEGAEEYGEDGGAGGERAQGPSGGQQQEGAGYGPDEGAFSGWPAEPPGGHATHM